MRKHVSKRMGRIFRIPTALALDILAPQRKSITYTFLGFPQIKMSVHVVGGKFLGRFERIGHFVPDTGHTFPKVFGKCFHPRYLAFFNGFGGIYGDGSRHLQGAVYRPKRSRAGINRLGIIQ
jgi:hypothetical protein